MMLRNDLITQLGQQGSNDVVVVNVGDFPVAIAGARRSGETIALILDADDMAEAMKRIAEAGSDCTP
jgi:hypothetical protein